MYEVDHCWKQLAVFGSSSQLHPVFITRRKDLIRGTPVQLCTINKMQQALRFYLACLCIAVIHYCWVPGARNTTIIVIILLYSNTCWAGRAHYFCIIYRLCPTLLMCKGIYIYLCTYSSTAYNFKINANELIPKAPRSIRVLLSAVPSKMYKSRTRGIPTGGIITAV